MYPTITTTIIYYKNILGRFSDCDKGNCVLAYLHVCTQSLQASCVYIWQSILVCVKYYTYTHTNQITGFIFKQDEYTLNPSAVKIDYTDKNFIVIIDKLMMLL